MSEEMTAIMTVFWAGVSFGLIPYAIGAAVQQVIRSVDAWHE